MRAFLTILILTVAISAQGIIPQRRQAESTLFGGGVPQAGASGTQIPVNVDLYALGADGWIWRQRSCEPELRRLFRLQLFSVNETAIGIDFRPADGQLYILSDNGTIYQADIAAGRRGNTVRVSVVSPRFAGGFQSLADFNPVVDALRLIGSNDQNFAVVNSGGNLNVTALQTAITYAAGDANQGQNPNLSGGAYTNNVTGAATTLFYALDFDLDTLVTIDPGANGSSATGGGQLRTIGNLVLQNGNPINLSPGADLDIFTDGQGGNTLIGLTGNLLFTLRELDIPAVQLGATVPVTVRAAVQPNGGFLDVAARLNLGRCRRGYDD